MSLPTLGKPRPFQSDGASYLSVRAVSEPIALELTARTGGYLGAQLFAGFMYVLAAFCLLFLRAWKVGELERGAAMKRPSPGGVETATGQLGDVEGSPSVSRYGKRMICWRIV
jgi:hypothetical protein